MNIEYEATFVNVKKNEIRKKIKDLGACLVQPEFLQKRKNFFLPEKKFKDRAFVRVRDEGEKITLAVKSFSQKQGIKRQQESEIIVNDFEKTEQILQIIGCELKNYQETKREIWKLEDVEIMIDEWPFLEPFVEIEGKNEKEVKSVAEKLGFAWEQAIFDSVDYQYSKKYNISRKQVNEKTPQLIFKMNNPFL